MTVDMIVDTAIDITDGIITNFEQILYEFFKNNVEIAKEIKNIYSYPPPNAIFPYIYLGPLNAEDKSTKCETIYQLTKQINIYITEQSPLRLYKISDIIIANLNSLEAELNYKLILLDKTNIRVRRIQIGEQNIFTATFILKFLIGENYVNQ